MDDMISAGGRQYAIPGQMRSNARRTGLFDVLGFKVVSLLRPIPPDEHLKPPAVARQLTRGNQGDME